jgi:hypothetical protein
MEEGGLRDPFFDDRRMSCCLSEKSPILTVMMAGPFR